VLNPAFPLQGMRDERTYITLSEGFFHIYGTLVNYCAGVIFLKNLKRSRGGKVVLNR